MKLRVLKQLSKLQEEGWNVHAPMRHIANVLSKTNTGQKLIVESKIGLALFEKLKPIAKFLEKHPMAREGLAYGEDASPSSLTNTNSLYTYPVEKWQTMNGISILYMGSTNIIDDFSRVKLYLLGIYSGC